MTRRAARVAAWLECVACWCAVLVSVRCVCLRVKKAIQRCFTARLLQSPRTSTVHGYAALHAARCLCPRGPVASKWQKNMAAQSSVMLSVAQSQQQCGAKGKIQAIPHCNHVRSGENETTSSRPLAQVIFSSRKLVPLALDHSPLDHLCPRYPPIEKAEPVAGFCGRLQRFVLWVDDAHTLHTGASQSSLRPRLIGLRPRLPRRLVASGIAMRCMSPLVRPILPAILRQRMAAAERAYWFVSLAEDGQTSRRAAARHRGQHSLGRSTQHPPCAFTLAWPPPRPQPHPAWSRPNRRAPSCVSVRRRAESCRRGEGRGQRGAERS